MIKLDILQLDTLTMTIEKIDVKTFYEVNKGEELSTWIKNEKCDEKFEVPQFISSLNISQRVGPKLSKNFLGYLNFGGNNINCNLSHVGFYSSAYSGGGTDGKGYSPGFEVNSENFSKSCLGFSARKLIKTNWMIDKDQYLVPNINHPEFSQMTYDSIVFSLFEISSNQTSLRQVEYKNQLRDIKNEFFWMSVEKMKELADQNGYDELYNDARTSSDRYVFKLLFGEERVYDKLSPDAKAVLDKATELVERSIEVRQVMANDENHLNSWDAGYAQLKLVWKEYFQEEFKEFRQLYKSLEDRMRPLVYELGFLKK